MFNTVDPSKNAAYWVQCRGMLLLRYAVAIGLFLLVLAALRIALRLVE